MKLYPYQVNYVKDIRRAVARGHKRILVVAPTGSGKTVIASQIMLKASEKNSHVLFLAHRRELIKQASATLDKFGCPNSKLMAGEEGGHENVQIASVQTLQSRAKKRAVMPYPRADIIIIDEAHRSASKTYLDIIARYERENPNTIVLGITATPVRGDRRGLGGIYDHLIQSKTLRGLTREGYLVPVRYFAREKPDLTNVEVDSHTRDYNMKQLQAAMNKKILVGDVVSNWLRLGENRATMIFASGVKHSIHIRDSFRAKGILAEHVDGETDYDERKEIIRKINAKEITILTSCSVFLEGFDCPPISCGMLARPTRSLGLYLQMAGRLLRKSPLTNKKDTLLIDHSGAVERFGFVDRDIVWALDDRELEHNITEREKKAPAIITCQSCSHVYESLPSCPECGHKNERYGKDVEHTDEDLVEVGTPKIFSVAEKQAWYAQLRWWGENRGFNPSWARHRMKQKFGEFPPWNWEDSLQPIELKDLDVRNFITHCNIAYSKGKKKSESTGKVLSRDGSAVQSVSSLVYDYAEWRIRRGDDGEIVQDLFDRGNSQARSEYLKSIMET